MNARPLIALTAAATLTLAACGDDDDDAGTADVATADAAGTATTAAPEAAPDTTAAGAATTAPADSGRGGIYGTEGDASATTAPADTGGEAAGGATVAIASTGLGDVIVAADGMTMYMFVPDNAGPPTCTAECAVAWPPLFVDDGAAPTAGEGIDASLLGTAEHPEGGTQVTYNGWPLYYFAGDAAPGDTNGQGQGGVWYVLDAAGDPIE